MGKRQVDSYCALLKEFAVAGIPATLATRGGECTLFMEAPTRKERDIARQIARGRGFIVTEDGMEMVFE